MGSITSGVGLISGLDISSIVDQLMAIEARPRDLLRVRVGGIDAQKTALLDITARISAMMARFTDLVRPAFFTKVSATSSNAAVLSATASADLLPGTYSFKVQSLAAAHQLISGGFRDATAPLAPGSLTIESAAARVNRATSLDELNGHAGVERGSFEIVDGDGKTATIDIHASLTLDDVVAAINKAGTAISARIAGDGLVLADSTGKQFSIREVTGGGVAADLGFSGANTSGIGTLTGGDLISLSNVTPLSLLNDGNGLRRARAGGDFTITGSLADSFNVDLSGLLNDDTRVERLNNAAGVQLGRIKVTNRLGTSTEIDLTGLTTVGQVRDAINNANAGVNVVVTGSGLVVSDKTSATSGTLKIEDVGTGSAARGLGIAGNTTSATITGRQILRVDTLADVVAAVNFAKGNEAGSIQAAIAPQGDRLVIRDAGGGTGTLTLTALNDSRALVDLGLTEGQFGERGEPAEALGRRIIGGLDTVLLSTINGGAGVAVRDASGAGAVIHIADATGAQADVDLSNAETLADVMDAINASGLALRAGLDANGTRLVIQNTPGVSGDIIISDTTLNTAASLGIAGQGATIRGGDLERRYVNDNTRLDDLNAGRGVTRGKFRITDSNGVSAVIDLAPTSTQTLQDVIELINARGIGVKASINATGDGLLLEDTAGGTKTLTVAEEGSTAARDLNLLSPAVGGKIDGAFEYNVSVSGGETLNDLVAKINKTTLAQAAVYNTGGGTSPYRLSVSSRASGTVGELLIDSSALGADFSTLTRAADAEVLVGDAAGGGVVVRSSDNTLEDVIPGLTLNLLGTSDTAVTVNATRDTDAIVEQLNGFVSDFNAIIDRISALSKYNAETEEAGVLLGDATTVTVSNRLSRLTSLTTNAAGLLHRLSDLGVKVSDGGHLSLDETKFRKALDADPEAVVSFFTDTKSGVAVSIKSALEKLSGTDGLLKRRDQALDKQRTDLSSRIDDLTELLDRKRLRLLRQFQAMEQALAGLQSQQTALASIGFASTSSSTNK